MEFEKIVLCVIGGILIFAFICVCYVKHYCLPSNNSFGDKRSIVQVGARGIVTKVPNSSFNVGDDVINEML